MSKVLRLLSFLPLLPSAASQAQDIRFRPEAGTVEVRGVNPAQLQAWREKEPDWKSVLRVFPSALRSEKKESIQPMLGRWFLSDAVLVFKPRFPFKEGLEYVAEWSGAGEVPMRVKVFEVPHTAAGPETTVENIFPSADRLPANLLKLYICFSAPMGLGNVYEHIRLLDEKGVAVDKPFLELDPPLWDKKQRRLTLWFDPGRIKTELQPNTSFGPPLSPEQGYTLLLSRELKDAFGKPLAASYKKHFFTLAADREMPAPQSWQTGLPAAYTRDRLTLQFPEPMDKAMLESGIDITDERDQPLAGNIEVSGAETQWAFVPEKGWLPGVYHIWLSPRLEDLAGNNLTRLFDNPVGNQGRTENAALPSSFKLQFEILKKQGE